MGEDKEISNIDISVIIPTYNREDFLTNTIKSLLDQNFENYEIIVVDNACLDSTKKLVELSNNNKIPIKYICEPNMGLHNARHIGAKEAKGDILLYIDDDVIADKNLLKEIIKFYSDPDVGCVGGKILPKWEVEPPEWINLFPKCYLSILDDEDGPKEVQWIYGCNFSIRKELLFKVGGFNPDAFGDKKMWWYRGDGEIGPLRKVHNISKKVIYNPNAVVWHFIPKSRLTIDYFKERAFKSGIEAGYVKYHYSNEPINLIKLILWSVVFGMYYFAHKIIALVLPSKSRVKHKVTASYYQARCLYELRLTWDDGLRRMVKKITG